MGEPTEPSLLQTLKSRATLLGFRDKEKPVLPQHNSTIHGPSVTSSTSNTTLHEKPGSSYGQEHRDHGHVEASRNHVIDKPEEASSGDGSQAGGETTAPVESKLPMPTRMKHGTKRFIRHLKNALLYSWINTLLIFVPVGIAVHSAKLGPEVVFATNAIAIIPLAGLLSHATEAVAVRVGDTLGALLNVSFGNAVELILFIILLAGDQIRVVQAALLGSILANLLLILGMAFLLGGLRYQEQIYNSTVTQMSACMLSLAVMSLLLPTAFHASFSNYQTADRKTLYVSRGTSVILLLVYVLYLLFQLKSHSYMYASTPQHIIDEESHPGILADILNSSSSSDSSSDSSSSSSNSSVGSHTTAKRIKRAFRNRRRRKSNASSKETASVPSVMSAPSVEHPRQFVESQRQLSLDHEEASQFAPRSRRGSMLNAIMSGDEADTDEHARAPVVRDFEVASTSKNRREKLDSKHKKKHRKHGRKGVAEISKETAPLTSTPRLTETTNRVAFAAEVQTAESAPTPKRTLRPVLPSLISNNIFNNPQNPPPPPGVSALSNVRMAGPRTIRRTTSLPDRMNRVQSSQSSIHSRSALSHVASAATVVPDTPEEEGPPLMSRTAAVVMLIISTALVAVCADFMSEAIEPMVAKTNVSQAFIGLIILPIVGNAAEHVTAVTVAAKNKMDLAIGVAVGSSIQIAIFITPVIVILGWIMGKEMSLYFNIFETIALFATVFVVNFLVLDGRSNYLEGSLLIAAYIIIALASFFYPDDCDASQIGGYQEGVCPKV